MITDQYFAGLFDGEGCISATKRKQFSTFSVDPYVRIGMSVIATSLIMEISTIYGGTIQYAKAKKINHNDVIAVVWSSKNDIEFILGRIEPYLVLKREQTKLLLWWVRNTGNYNRYGINQAKVIFIDELREMKKNPLRKAETAIQHMEECFNKKDLTVVSIT